MEEMALAAIACGLLRGMAREHDYVLIMVYEEIRSSSENIPSVQWIRT